MKASIWFKSLSTLGLILGLSIVLINIPGEVSGQGPDAEVGVQAALGTGFTYQGQLTEDGGPVNDTCDLTFKLYDADSGGAQVGRTVNTTAAVDDGLFTVQLDFGANAFRGEARWLDIAVRCPAGTGDYADLGRQALTPAPYALALPGLWTEQGAISPNLIGGYSGNSVTTGTYGATIGGGGNSTIPNRVTDNYGTVSGGSGNRAGNDNETLTDATFATVGGGRDNTAGAYYATVSGGRNNTADGWYTTIGGGVGNTADAYGATVPGGWNNAAQGERSFAAGRRAKALHRGAFVWADDRDADFASTGVNQFLIRASGGVGIGTTNPTALLDVAGRTRTIVLQITGGSDLAEPFEIAGAENVAPGMVVAIDAQHPGQLRIADQAYDRTVAGCVSGANGVRPGLIMQQEGTVADGAFPVALSGRVYCWADAAYGAIEPGDLLTTSDTPGHVMKVSDYARAQGATIGKAMSPLAQGQALVLVLVSLQ